MVDGDVNACVSVVMVSCNIDDGGKSAGGLDEVMSATESAVLMPPVLVQ